MVAVCESLSYMMVPNQKADRIFVLSAFGVSSNLWHNVNDAVHGCAIVTIRILNSAVGSGCNGLMARVQLGMETAVIDKFYSSSVLVSPSGRPWARALRTRRMILPLRVLGSLDMK